MSISITDSIRGVLPIGYEEDGVTLKFPEGVEPYYIRTTERGNFKKCRRLWNYSSQNRMNLEPVKMANALSFGIAIHEGLEAYYNPETWHYPHDTRVQLMLLAFTEAIEEQRKTEDEARKGLDLDRNREYDEQLELGLGMLKRYAEWAPKQDKGITPIAVEKKYQMLLLDENGIPLVVNGHPVVYQIRVDLLLRDKHGRLWVLDHKTTATLSDLGHLDLDTQLSTYPWVVSNLLGERVEGVLYNELEKTVPHPPKVLKSGKLSQDKKQLTTSELYSQAIRENGLDSGPYETMLEYLRENPRDYFRRTPVLRTPEELEYQGRLVLAEVRDMLIGPSDGPSIYPNPERHCNYCDFRAPCTIENEQGDVEFILNDPSVYRERS